MAFSKGKQKDINLLPEVEGAARFRKIKLVTTAAALAVVVLLILSCVTISLLAFSENQKAKSIASKSASQVATWQQLSKTAEKMSLAKAKKDQLAVISATNQTFVASLEKIRGRVPSGVTLSNLTVKSIDSLSLQATATSPATIYQFVEELKKEKLFTQVSVSSLVKNKDQYTLSLTLKAKP